MDFPGFRHPGQCPLESEVLRDTFTRRIPETRVRTISETSGAIGKRSDQKDICQCSAEDSTTNTCYGMAGQGCKNSKHNRVMCNLEEGSRPRSGSKGLKDFFRMLAKLHGEDTEKISETSTDRKNRTVEDQGQIEGHIGIHEPKLSLLMDSSRERSHSDAASSRRHELNVDTWSGDRTKDDGENRHSKDEENGISKIHRHRNRTESGPSNRDRCEPTYSPQRSRAKKYEESNCFDAATLNTLRVAGYSNVYDKIANDSRRRALSPQPPVKAPCRIGPAEFLEMYRNRAYSEPRPQARLDAVANVRMRKLRSSNISNEAGFSGLATKKLILWRDKESGSQLLVLPADSSDTNEIENINLNESVELVCWRILKSTKCYDVIPSSTKMVVLDSQLSVKKALYALLNNGIQAAPIWDSKTQRLTGMLTVTDFIRVLQKYYRMQPTELESLENHSILTFKGITGTVSDRLTSVSPEDSLLEAISLLRHNAIHRLPVLDPVTGNILYLLTYRRLLKFLNTATSQNCPTFMQKSINELNIGTFDNIAMVDLDTPVISALELLIDRRISASPVVDSNQKLVTMYTRADAINLAAENTYSKLDTTIGQLLRNHDTQMLTNGYTKTCSRNDPLTIVIEKIIQGDVHRLPITDDDGHVQGIVSVSDIIRYIDDQRESPV